MRTHSIGQEMTFNRFTGALRELSREEFQERLHRESSLFYSHKPEYLGLKVFQIETYDVIAESQADAEEIYKRATV